MVLENNKTSARGGRIESTSARRQEDTFCKDMFGKGHKHFMKLKATGIAAMQSRNRARPLCSGSDGSAYSTIAKYEVTQTPESNSSECEAERPLLADEQLEMLSSKRHHS